MNMKLKKIGPVVMLASLVLFAAFAFARAEDDENENDDDDERETTVQSAPSTSSSQKTVTKTIILEPERKVTTTQIRDVQVPDSDRDGLADENDPHPAIPEQLIVKDDNLNGIDDRYEIIN